MEPVFNIILEEIIKRKRTTIPMVVLTGSRFSEYSSKYNICNIDRTILDQDKFVFRNNISGKINFDDYKNNDYYKQEKFIFTNNTSGTINFDDYKKELLYLKLFTKNIEKSISTEYKHLIRSTAIIKINDTTDKLLRAADFPIRNNFFDEECKKRKQISINFILNCGINKDGLTHFINNKMSSSEQETTLETFKQL